MLGKLLKYDLKSLFKFLSIFYMLSLFFAILTRIFLNIENSVIMNIIGKICSGATISMMVSILINNMMRGWVRFRQNTYGDESYLTHTLPVSKKQIYLSKFLMAFITMFVSIVVIGISIFIAYYSKENLEILKNSMLQMADIYESSIIRIVVIILFLFFLEMLNLLQSGYTGIILGHKKNTNKIGFSVLFSFITYIIIQIFVLFITFIMGLFNSDIMNLFITNEMVNIQMLKLIMYVSILTYALCIFISYWINIKLLNKGVNVE